MDLEALVTDELRTEIAGYALESYSLEAGTGREPHASVVVRTPDGETARGEGSGDGSVDSVFAAINAATGVDASLREFRIDAVTEGKDALGEVSVVIVSGGQSASGQGVATDIVEAAARAYLRALTTLERRDGAQATPRRSARRSRRSHSVRRAPAHVRSGTRSYVIAYEPHGAPRDQDLYDATAVGPRVRALREAMGLSLRELALRCGVSAAMLSQVERGETSPTLQVAARIAAGLDLRLSQLLRLDESGSVTIVRAGERAAGGSAAARAPLRGADAADPRPARSSSPMHTLARRCGHRRRPTTRRCTSRAAARSRSSSRARVTLLLRRARLRAGAGDCVTFDADLPHHFENHGPERGAPAGGRLRRPAPLPSHRRQDTMPQTLLDKIWEAHEVAPGLLYIDLHLVHEVTSPQAFDGLRLAGRRVRRPDRTVATADHNVPTDGTTRAAAITRRALARAGADARAQLRASSASRSTRWAPTRQGIVHVIGPELGVTQPGMTIVCGDSHTATHGAFGALAFGIGTSEVEHVLATQCLVQHKPRAMRIRYEGDAGFGVTAKDLILATIGQIGVDGAVGHVVEYAGPAISALSMEGRMTLCNMTIEGGGRAGMVAPDEITFEWFERTRAPGSRQRRRSSTRAIEGWRELRSDDDAQLRQRGRRRRRRDLAAGDLGHQPRAWSSASPTACPRPRTSTTPADRDAAERALRLHGPRRAARRSRRSAWTASSSAPAPTRGSATCAPRRR